MKSYVKLMFYAFGLYYLVMGLIAVFSPGLAAGFYGATELGPEASLAARWVGALALAIAYGAFAVVSTLRKEILRLLLIAALATIAANVLAVFAGDARFGQLLFDFVIHVGLVAAVILAQKE